MWGGHAHTIIALRLTLLAAEPSLRLASGPKGTLEEHMAASLSVSQEVEQVDARAPSILMAIAAFGELPVTSFEKIEYVQG